MLARSGAECVTFLQWALPRLDLRWSGFRNVRGQVCKRIKRRIAQLGLADVAAYRARLEVDPAEWGVLDALCVVTISRFYRDRAVWDALQNDILPALAAAAIARQQQELRCWSIGCASGEEPYTLAIVWKLGLAQRYPGLRLRVLGTDIDERVLARARVATYSAATLRDLPALWREQAFAERADSFQLRDSLRAAVDLRQEDIRLALPDRNCDLMLCRNLVFTYFDETLQRKTLDRLLTSLSGGGAFLIGRHERLPSGTALEPWHSALGIYRNASRTSA